MSNLIFDVNDIIFPHGQKPGYVTFHPLFREWLFKHARVGTVGTLPLLLLDPSGMRTKKLISSALNEYSLNDVERMGGFLSMLLPEEREAFLSIYNQVVFVNIVHEDFARLRYTDKDGLKFLPEDQSTWIYTSDPAVAQTVQAFGVAVTFLPKQQELICSENLRRSLAAPNGQQEQYEIYLDIDHTTVASGDHHMLRRSMRLKDPEANKFFNDLKRDMALRQRSAQITQVDSHLVDVLDKICNSMGWLISELALMRVLNQQNKLVLDEDVPQRSSMAKEIAALYENSSVELEDRKKAIDILLLKQMSKIVSRTKLTLDALSLIARENSRTPEERISKLDQMGKEFCTEMKLSLSGFIVPHSLQDPTCTFLQELSRKHKTQIHLVTQRSREASDWIHHTPATINGIAALLVKQGIPISLKHALGSQKALQRTTKEFWQNRFDRLRQLLPTMTEDKNVILQNPQARHLLKDLLQLEEKEINEWCAADNIDPDCYNALSELLFTARFFVDAIETEEFAKSKALFILKRMLKLSPAERQSWLRVFCDNATHEIAHATSLLPVFAALKIKFEIVLVFDILAFDRSHKKPTHIEKHLQAFMEHLDVLYSEEEEIAAELAALTNKITVADPKTRAVQIAARVGLSYQQAGLLQDPTANISDTADTSDNSTAPASNAPQCS